MPNLSIFNREMLNSFTSNYKKLSRYSTWGLPRVLHAQIMAYEDNLDGAFLICDAYLSNTWLPQRLFFSAISALSASDLIQGLILLRKAEISKVDSERDNFNLLASHEKPLELARAWVQLHHNNLLTRTEGPATIKCLLEHQALFRANPLHLNSSVPALNGPSLTSFPEKHSEKYFGKSRNYWWNNDFIELMAKRWDLTQVQSVLDVGCGIGHWGFVLSRVLPKTATLVGIDREPEWVRKSTEMAKGCDLDSRYSYCVGDANRLDFPDNSFDMVTCQTVLIHVADVEHVLREMIRVLKPGGILVTIEPNNISRSLCLSTLDVDNSVDDIIDISRFQLLCERGKMALKEGYISIGDQLPKFFAKQGLHDIRTYISDRAKTFYPPYQSEEEQAIIKELKEWSKNLFWIWDKKDSQRYYLAGGGEPDKFEYYWSNALDRQNDRVLEGIEKGDYAAAGGKINYCISGRK